MPRALMVIAAVLIILGRTPAFAADIKVSAQAEYRRDAIDYESEVRDYYREKLIVGFSRASRFSFTGVQAENTEGFRCTWNLSLSDISPHFSLMLGNFHAHFGSGLIMGKQCPYDPDVFSRKGAIADASPFSAAQSGNPHYAFHGIAAGLHYQSDFLSLAAYAFYSATRRYISQKSIDEGHAAAGLSTIEGKSVRSYPDIEPVEHRTSGALFTASCARLFSLQAYGLNTSLASADGERILYSYRHEDGGVGVSDYRGGGVHLAYRDENILLFLERDYTASRFLTGDSGAREVTGAGALAGVKINLPILRLSATGRETDSGFFSPYSATIGEEFTAKGIYLDLGFTPYRNLLFSASSSAERREDPGSRSGDISVLKRQALSVKYELMRLGEFDLAARFYQRDSGEEIDEKRQARSHARVDIAHWLSLDLSGTAQESSGRPPSKIATLGISAKIFRCFTENVSITRARIGEGNPVYARILPMKNSNIPGTFIRKDAVVGAWRSSFALNGIFISWRVVHQRFSRSESNTTMELFGSGQF